MLLPSLPFADSSSFPLLSRVSRAFSPDASFVTSLQVLLLQLWLLPVLLVDSGLPELMLMSCNGPQLVPAFDAWLLGNEIGVLGCCTTCCWCS
jgi:hypothetical protein